MENNKIIRGHHISRMISLWASNISEEDFLNGVIVKTPIPVFWDSSSNDIYGPTGGTDYYNFCKSFSHTDKILVNTSFDDFCNQKCKLRHWCGKLPYKTMSEWFKYVTNGKYKGYHKSQHNFSNVDKEELNKLNLIENNIYTIKELYNSVINYINRNNL